MQTIDYVVIGAAVIGGIALYGMITSAQAVSNIPNDILNIPSDITNAVYKKSLQSGANNGTNSNNYTNAQILIPNNTAQYQSDLNIMNNAFKNAQTNPVIVVSPNGQTESSYGGNYLSPAQRNIPSTQGSASNPYDYEAGWQGSGMYAITSTQNGAKVSEEIGTLYDYNNSYLNTFITNNPNGYI